MLNGAARDFVRERVCFYSTVLNGRSLGREIIEDAIRFGAGGVELSGFCPELSEPDLSRARELGSLARRGGLSLPCFSLGLDILKNGEETEFERAKGYADICSELEIPYLHHTVILSFSDPDVYAHRSELFARGAEFALRLNEYARERGVRTVMEDQGLVFNGVDSFARLRAVTDNRIGVLLDVGNIMFVNERADDFLRAFSEDTVHVHVKDYKRLNTPEDGAHSTVFGYCLGYRDVGEGDADLRSVSGLLNSTGYRGMLALELERAEDDRSLLTTLERTYRVFG